MDNDKRYREILKEVRLMDDLFMSKVFEGQNELVEFILKIILKKDDIKVVSVKTQEQITSLMSRSVCLDVYATDSDNKKYDIEIQRESSGGSPKRARYHSSIIDSNELEKGTSFEDLPEKYVIFIMEKDIYKEGLAVYHVDRVIRETGQFFGDEEHIIYVNGEYSGDDDVGKLMNDFRECNPDKMNFEVIRERTKYFKDTEKGEWNMGYTMDQFKADVYREAEEMVEKGLAEGMAKGVAQGMAQGMAQNKDLFKRLKNDGRIDEFEKALDDEELYNSLLKEYNIA